MVPKRGVCELACGVDDTAWKGLIGQRVSIPRDTAVDLARRITAVDWPAQSRKTIHGRGTAVGATYEINGPRLGHWTRRSQKLIMKINAAIKEALGDTHFEWGSLQINLDSVSDVHVDKNNVGPSMIFLLGEFTGGAFRVQGSPIKFAESGQGLFIDGSKPHYSEPFTGTRVSVVAFLHKETESLSMKDRCYLRYLGFQFGGPGSDVFPCGIRGCTGEEPQRTIVEFCCEPDSLMGQPTEASCGCLVVRLTADDDMTSQSGMAKAKSAIRLAGSSVMLWGSLPCTGGCTWQRVNASRGAETEAKIRAHWALFELLWMSFEELACLCLQQGGCVALEWPSACRYWKRPRVVAFLDQHGFKKTTCHGCSYGVAATTGQDAGKPILKPWTIATTSVHVLSKLTRKCNKSHEHAACAGYNTSRTGRYTQSFVWDVHTAFASHVEHDSHVASSVAVSALRTPNSLGSSSSKTTP